MIPRSLTDDELMDVTACKIGHCNDLEQLAYIIRYTEARIKELHRQRTKK